MRRFGRCSRRLRLLALIKPWMGHKDIKHTVRHTELVPDRFKDFWRH